MSIISKLDFTLTLYKKLLLAFKKNNYEILTVRDYFTKENTKTKVLIIRHDVDRRPKTALRLAKLENEAGVKTTYYFRTIPKTFKPKIIKGIADLGHEIGYHYENITHINRIKDIKDENHLFKLAYEDFKSNLGSLRRYYPIKTICMHGASWSKYDNKSLWNKYNYKQLDIIAEPYLDLNFSKVLYLTDSGQSWNGNKYTVRDKIKQKFNYNFYHTNEIINTINELPKIIMITTHPNRWASNIIEWFFINLQMISKREIKRLVLWKRLKESE